MRAGLERLFGGSPLAVLAKLLFLSLVLGAIMAGLGLSPWSIPRRLLAALQSLTDLGMDAVHDVGRYVVTGAVIVVPVWLVMRVLRGR